MELTRMINLRQPPQMKHSTRNEEELLAVCYR